jgi:murein DD-endopeptidase MepM/ murein hydrolase activator NlpD
MSKSYLNRSQIHLVFIVFLLICSSLTGCSATDIYTQTSVHEIALASAGQSSGSLEIYQPFQDVASQPQAEITAPVDSHAGQDQFSEPRDTDQFTASATTSMDAPTQVQSTTAQSSDDQKLEPLRFVFPTQVADSSTLWRPPLYSIPWEPTPNDHFYFIRPIGANEINWPLANYRYGGVFFEDVVHTGIDIPAPKGTPVMAAGSGTVVWAGYGLYFLRPEFRDPYGLAVAIKHDFGYQGNDLYTVYGHMDELFAYQGQQVQPGDLIGTVGETGKVTGPHLHFEVRVDKNNYFGSRNPELWIAPPQGWGIIAARVMDRSGDLLERHSIMLRNIETNHYWTVLSYGKGSVNPDAYYQENMVIGDLPAGKYVIWIKYEGTIYDKTIEVLPGKVSYFRFVGSLGYDTDEPRTPQATFTPPDSSGATLP